MGACVSAALVAPGAMLGWRARSFRARPRADRFASNILAQGRLATAPRVNIIAVAVEERDHIVGERQLGLGGPSVP